MDIGKPALSVLLGVLAWLLYAGMITAFPKQLNTCYRLGKTFIWRSLLNGIIAYAAMCASLFAVLFFAKTSGIMLYISVIGILSMAGCSAGFMLAGSLFNIIDGAKTPYRALTAGIAASVSVNVFSDSGQLITILIGIYGLGTIILNLRGAWLDLPAEPAAAPVPAILSGITPVRPGEEAGRDKPPDTSPRTGNSLRKPSGAIPGTG